MSNEIPHKESRLVFGGLALLLLVVVVGGLMWLAVSPPVPGQKVGVLLSFAAGLSMIFLPCTLPLVFVIVPMALKQKPWKGLLMALVFGLGLSITLSLYGVAVALIGKWLGMDSITRVMFAVAGILAYIFGLYELKLGRFGILGFHKGIPQFIQRQSDLWKSFFMGLFLGNAGVGCPNPAFYVLLLYIATTANVAGGFWLGLVHGLGRAVPLILVTIFAIIGVNAAGWVAKKKDDVERIMGWALVAVGLFIFQYGIFGMFWWEESPIHKGWNRLIEIVAPRFAETTEAAIFFGVVVSPSEIEKYIPWAPWAVMLLFLVITIRWFRCKRRVEKTSV